MKFTHTLIINDKEVNVLNEALKMYASQMTKLLNEEKFGIIGRDRFEKYRHKVLNMAKVMEDIKNTPKEVVSEASIYSKERIKELEKEIQILIEDAAGENI